MNYISEEARQIHHDVKHCDADEIMSLYGIEVREDGTVYDATYLKEYASLDDWINASTEDDTTGFEKFSKYDDDEFF